jgi:[NiFe] hydrogenase assembly HybE family chaperone
METESWVRDPLLSQAVGRLVETFRFVEANRMAGLPFLNPALCVEASGFRLWEGLPDMGVGILISPWFINGVVLPLGHDPWGELPVGTKKTLDLPAGRFSFLVNREERTGTFLSCSFFSPVEEWTGMMEAREAARVLMETLFSGEESSPERKETQWSRRQFLRGGR